MDENDTALAGACHRKSCWSRRVWCSPPRSPPSSRNTKPRSGRITAPPSWPAPGPTRPTRHGSWRDATAAIAELGFTGVQGEDMVVVENTPAVHNMVVCTLCSCYPWPTLGPAAELVQVSTLSIARRLSTRAACWRNSASSCPETRKSACGTATPSCAIWCCRSARPEPRRWRGGAWRAGDPGFHDRHRRCRTRPAEGGAP